MLTQQIVGPDACVAVSPAVNPVPPNDGEEMSIVETSAPVPPEDDMSDMDMGTAVPSSEIEGMDPMASTEVPTLMNTVGMTEDATNVRRRKIWG